MASFPMNRPEPGRRTTHRVVEGASNQRKSGRFVYGPRLSADGVGVQGGDGENCRLVAGVFWRTKVRRYEGTKVRRHEGTKARSSEVAKGRWGRGEGVKGRRGGGPCYTPPHHLELVLALPALGSRVLLFRARCRIKTLKQVQGDGE